ncbi:hypothetical protein [Specibacter sp. NPDC078692]|uniref:hypothetical protein n=1 Tax=Specibacter sp. NPDC078692 TaxID=3155818 RepID=UPI0034222EC4
MVSCAATLDRTHSRTGHTSLIKESVGSTAVVLSADEHAAVSALAASVGVAGAGYSGHHLGLVDG